MNKVVLSLGSNSKDREVCIKRCKDWLASKLVNFCMSHIYETSALNGKDNNYLNAVAIGLVDIDYDAAFKLFKEYEKINGRTIESKRNGQIPIDIDIVIWNDIILRENDFNQSYFQIGWEMLNN